MIGFVLFFSLLKIPRGGHPPELEMSLGRSGSQVLGLVGCRRGHLFRGSDAPLGLWPDEFTGGGDGICRLNIGCYCGSRWVRLAPLAPSQRPSQSARDDVV